MKKQIKKLVPASFVAVVVLLLLQISVFAAITLEEPVVDYNAGTITISGTLSENESGNRVTYTITDAAGNVVYMNQGVAGYQGVFSDVALLSGLYDGGSYTVSVLASGYDTPMTATFTVDRSQEVVYATDVAINGLGENETTVGEGTELTGTYTFFSGFGQEEGESRYSWAIGPTAEGPFNYVIEGATSTTYTFHTEDILEIVQAHESEFTTDEIYIQFAVEALSEGSEYYAEKVGSVGVALSPIPMVTDVSISGTASVGRTLTGEYTLVELTGRQESQSTYRWLISNSENGTYTQLASGLSYIVGNEAEGKYLKFEVTPAVKEGENSVKGAPVLSDSIRVSGGSSTSGGGSGSGGGGGGGYGPSGGFTTEVSGDTPDTVVTPNTPESIPGEFADVPAEHWAKSIIKEVVLRGDANGVSETEFEPERSITRAEFAKLMLNTLDLEETDYTGGFSDVSADDWYAGAVQTVADQGLMEGFDGAFQPEAYITREEMAKVVYEAYIAGGGEAIADADLSFSDVSDISDWALEAVTQASELELINGNPDGSFAPAAQATRAEAVTIINRFYHILNA